MMAVGTEQEKVDTKAHPAAKESAAIIPVWTEQRKVAKTASPRTRLSGWLQWLWGHKGKILAVVLLVVAIAGVGWMLFRPYEVVVATVVEQETVAEVEGTGTVTTRVLAQVGSKINGRIEKMLVQEGDVVEELQIVAVLEDTDLRRQLDIARAEMEGAMASALEAKRTRQRMAKLVSTGAVSKEDVDVAEAHQGVTEKAVTAHEAHVAYAEFKVTETKVPTVVAGLVTKRWVEAGATVVAGQPVLTVAETSLIIVNANVDQRFTGKVHKGQAATVILRGRTAQPFTGYVYRVYPQADSVTEEMLVQVAFPMPPEQLQVGQWAEVYIEVDKATKCLVVPKEAIMSEGNDRFVFVAGKDGRARRVIVQLGATSPRLPVVAVTGEVMSGDQVILMPMGLKDGQRVRVKQSRAKGLPGREPMPPMMPPGMKM
jgi:RND family efflux transporter MFP subunit